MKTKAILAALSLVLLVSIPVMADVPDEITYQGRLVYNGSPVTTATSIIFRLFQTSSGGSAVWTETHGSVTPDSNGIYTVVLGEATAIPDDYDALWLELEVAGNTLAPRKKLTSAPFVLRAGELPNLYVSGSVGIGTMSPSLKLDVAGAIRSKQLKVDTEGTYLGLDVSGCNTVALTHLTGSVVIDGLSGGVAGQILHIFKVQGAPGTTVTIKHRTSSVQGEQITVLSNKTDLVLGQSDYGKGVTLVNIDGWGWYEIDH